MSKDSTATNNTVAIACNVYTLSEAERHDHFALAEALFAHDVEETRELDNGYAFGFAAAQFSHVAAFVANERRCCPFLTFCIEVAPSSTTVELRLTGDAQIKAFLKLQFNL